MTQLPAPTYQHVVVIMSMVLGISITQLLKGGAQVYRNRARVHGYWLHWGWVTLLLLFALLLWWTFWNYRGIGEWDFARFVAYLAPIIVLSIVTNLAFPDPTDDVTSLKEYYFAQRRGFFGAFAVCAVLTGVTAFAVRGLPLLDASNLFRLALIALLLTAMRSASERVHAVVFALGTLLLAAFVLLMQFRIG